VFSFGKDALTESERLYQARRAIFYGVGFSVRDDPVQGYHHLQNPFQTTGPGQSARLAGCRQLGLLAPRLAAPTELA